MEMLEMAARAICTLDRRDADALEPGNAPYSDGREIIDGRCANGDPGFFVWRLYVPIARAVMEAMRKPSEGVCDKLNDLLDCQGAHQTVEESWADLIDAALAETVED